MEAVYVALIVAVAGFLGQWLLKRQEFARQDEVAAQAAKAAQLLLERQDAVAAQAAEAAQLLLIANERVANTARATNEKLDTIHTLVNSNMTAAMQAELDARAGQLVTMKEIIALRREHGADPTPEASAAVTAATERIRELQANLYERMAQNQMVEAEQARRLIGYEAPSNTRSVKPG